MDFQNIKIALLNFSLSALNKVLQSAYDSEVVSKIFFE